MKLEVHPLAELFPDLSAGEFSEMVQSIKDDGLDEPIVVSDGKILDGRHRYKACLKAGVTPTTVAYDGPKTPEAIAKFVWRANGVRRHLTASQRSMIAAKMANADEGQPYSTAQNCAVSQEDAAETVNVSRRSVQNATKVLKEADPEVVEAVSDGTVAVADAAAVSDKPKPAQRKAVKKVKSGKAKTLKAAVNGATKDTASTLFKATRETLGKAGRQIVDLNKKAPAPKFHSELDKMLNDGLGVLTNWQRAVR